MTPFEPLRIIGPIVMLAVVVLGIFAITRFRLGKDISISLHISATKTFYIAMGLLLTFAGAAFYLFLAFWMVPFYNVHPFSYVLIVIAFIGQLGMAWIPDSSKDQRLHLLHFASGGTVAICMILFLATVGISSNNLPPVSSVLILTYTIASCIYLFFYSFFKRFRQKHFLIYESVFIGMFALICGLLSFGV